MQHFRTPESLKKKLDSMIKKYGNEFTIDHGIANYQFDHYEYYEPRWENSWTSCIIIYVKDFWHKDEVVEYGRYTEADLCKPTKYDLAWGYFEKYRAVWEKEFPTILEIREY